MKINLGCGDGSIPGFVNVDALPSALGVDVVADLSEPLPFPDGSASLIYASHVLEHFPTDMVPKLLADWRRVLSDGGELLVAVPNLETIAKLMVSRDGWFTPPHAPWIAVLYGGQKDEYDYHKTGFTPVWLAHLLGEAGFAQCQVVDRFHDIGKSDASFSAAPFGENISLKMRAIAGSQEYVHPVPPRTVVPFRILDRSLCWMLDASTAARAKIMLRRKRRLEADLESTNDE